jgi:hypothetical protein
MPLFSAGCGIDGLLVFAAKAMPDEQGLFFEVPICICLTIQRCIPKTIMKQSLLKEGK